MTGMLTADFEDFLRLLNERQVRYVVAGGFAIAAHGTPRYTKDLDVWVEVSPENAERLLLALDDFGMASLGLTSADLEERDMVLQLGYEPNRIDILTGLTGVEFHEAYPRRVLLQLGELRVPFLAREDLIANKRALGRPRDLADIEDLQADDLE
ncbi:nucleotidyl transferase AbiEii/AbiGii toxin family protein [Deinococcus aerius]|nr:nucleotidyl transferase AbiEii/AbiGii toxin family protein [Deinococcus aerius]